MYIFKTCCTTWAVSKDSSTCTVLNGFTRFYLPHPRFIPARVEQCLERHVSDSYYMTIRMLRTSECCKRKSSCLSVLGVEPRTFVTAMHIEHCVWTDWTHSAARVGAFSNWAKPDRQTCVEVLSIRRAFFNPFLARSTERAASFLLAILYLLSWFPSMTAIIFV